MQSGSDSSSRYRPRRTTREGGSSSQGDPASPAPWPTPQGCPQGRSSLRTVAQSSLWDPALSALTGGVRARTQPEQSRDSWAPLFWGGGWAGGWRGTLGLQPPLEMGATFHPCCKASGYQATGVCRFVGGEIGLGEGRGLPVPLKSRCTGHPYSAHL